MAVNEIKTILTLDDISFAGKLNKAQGQLLKFSAVGATIGAITTAAAIATAKWNTELATNAQKAGASVKEFSALSVAAKKFNVETNDLTKAISTLNTATPEVEKNLRRLGITVRDSGGFRQGSDVFLDLADKIAKLKTPAEQSAAAMAALGEDGAKLLPILSQGRDGFLSAQLAAQKYGLTVSEDAVKASEEFNRQAGEITMALQGATQALGNAAIEFANSTGAAQGLADAIAGVTAWFNDLSPSTQRVIMTVIGVTAAIAALTAALVAVSAIAPAIGAAFSIMLGPVGLVIAGVSAVVGVVAYLAASNKTASQSANDFIAAQNKQVAKSKELESTLSALSKKTQLNSQDQQLLAKAKRDLAAQAEALGRKLDVEALSLRELSAAAKEFSALTKEQSVKQLSEQIAEQKAVLAVQLQSLGQLARGGAESRAFIELREAVVEREKAIKRLIAAKKELEESEKRPVTSARPPPIDARKFYPELQYKDEILSAIDEIDTAQEKYALAQKFRLADGSIDAEKYNRALEDLANKQKQKQIEATSSTAQVATAYAKAVDKIASKVGQVISAISGITNAIASASRYAAEVAARDAEIDAIRSARLYEEQKTALEKSYDEKLNALKNGEKSLTLAMESEISQRLLLADEEYQAEKARIEQAYADKLAAAELDYQMTLEKNARDAAFLEQKRLNESVINANWDAFKKAQEMALQNELTAAAKGFADKQKAINAEGKTKIEAQTESSALEMQRIEDEKNAALAALDAQRTEQTKAEEKRRLQIQYDAAMDEYNQTIAVKVAATIATGIAGAAQAFAGMTGATLGFGVGAAAAVAGLVLASTAASVANLIKQKPVKPAGLLAEDGGLIKGPRHSQGGVDVNAEGGELIMPRDVSRAFLRMQSEENSGEKIVLSGTYNFYGTGGMEEFIDMLEEKLTGRILRTGAA